MTIDAGESAVFEKKAAEAAARAGADEKVLDNDRVAERFDVNYTCLRCGTITSGTEISRLPEIKCICGFKVFTKARPPVVKSIQAI